MSVNDKQRCTICFINIDGTNQYLRHLRHVHGNDRLFSTQCPSCDSKITFTNLKSFIHHFRKHRLNYLDDKMVFVGSSPGHGKAEIYFNDEPKQLCLSDEYEQHDPLEEIEQFYVKMLLKLREGHVLPGNIMTTLALSISCLLQTFSYYLLSKFNINVDNAISLNFHDDIEKSLLKISKNEDSFISACQDYFNFIKPKEIQLSNGSKAYYIPIRDLLMSIFEKSRFYECIKQEQEYISQFDGQDILYHYRNGEIGRQHPVLKNQSNCILLQLYSDDLGIVNPLMGKGSAHKLTTFYFSIDDLPARHGSSLNTIFLLLLCYRKDFEDETNRRLLFFRLDQDIRSLENDGLILPGDTVPTCFSISTMCADDLAAHELGGFTCSSNTGHCCRYCLVHHRDMKHIYKESQTLIRTIKSHDIQIKQVQNVNSDRSMYGVNEQSVLSLLSSLHPITSLPPDIMHDVLEGIMPKLSSCLLHAIVSTRICTASELCQRIDNFTYVTKDRRNRPALFKEKDIFNKRIPGKATEKYCLFLNLPFMLYDILDKIPYWFLYELLRQIWDIIYSDHPRKSWLSTLQELIEEFLQLFQTIFPEQFIPKCHFLLHAARNTAKYGPLKRQMNLRYEAKHHLLKRIAHRCNNFNNLPYTISRRVQLRQCYEIMNNNIFKPNVINGKFRKRRSNGFKQVIRNALLHDNLFDYGEFVECVKWVIIDNVKYMIGSFFVFYLLGGEEIPLFVEIKFIIHIKDEWRFVVHCYDTLTFKQNLHCYEINPSNVNIVLNKNEFLTHKAEDCYRINNLYFIRTPYRLTLVQ